MRKGCWVKSRKPESSIATYELLESDRRWLCIGIWKDREQRSDLDPTDAKVDEISTIRTHQKDRHMVRYTERTYLPFLGVASKKFCRLRLIAYAKVILNCCIRSLLLELFLSFFKLSFVLVEGSLMDLSSSMSKVRGADREQRPLNRCYDYQSTTEFRLVGRDRARDRL